MISKNKNHIPITIILFLLIITAVLLCFSPVKISFTITDIMIGVCCSVIYFINLYISLFIRRLNREKPIKNQVLVSGELRKYFKGGYVVLIIILISIIEELIFRSYLLNLSVSHLNIYVSVIINALLFSFIHFSKFKFIQLTLMGVLFATVTLLTNNLLPSIIAHVANNSIIFVKGRKNSIANRKYL
jgi:membrane protease YdiL (CAAX protease family)